MRAAGPTKRVRAARMATSCTGLSGGRNRMRHAPVAADPSKILIILTRARSQTAWASPYRTHCKRRHACIGALVGLLLPLVPLLWLADLDLSIFTTGRGSAESGRIASSALSDYAPRVPRRLTIGSHQPRPPARHSRLLRRLLDLLDVQHVGGASIASTARKNERKPKM